jgi:hypothetical protein
MVESAKILLLPVDSLLVDFCEADLTHQKLFPFFAGVVFYWGIGRKRIYFFELIAGNVHVIDVSLEGRDAIFIGGVFLFSIEPPHASNGGLGHLTVNQFFSMYFTVLFPLPR